MNNIKVAVVGAGISGLTAAYKLEEKGINPTIFEKEHKVGARFVNGEAMMHIINLPITDVFYYLSLNRELPLQPTLPIRKIIFYGPTNKATIVGDIGYITIRGNHERSLENQLAKLVDSPINYNNKPDYQKLKREFDEVIIATGDPRTIKKIDQWQQTDVSVKIIGATIEGKFNPTTVKMWLNHNLAPQGYAYLLPFGHKLASIAIATPHDIVDSKHLWSNFLDQLDFEFRIKDTFQVDHYEIGQTKTQQFDNTYLIGHAGGFVMPFLGFGQFSSIESGILVSQAITEGKDYNQLTDKLKKDYKVSLKLRKLFAKMSNNQYDKLVKALNNRVVKKMFLQRKINLAKIIGWLSTPLV
ncbi:NAD(P)/FAD-dependent oxidoreductase [Acetohalobium arabaticum]|uniref:FAD dependent oxidoreductase n=1 Tax=Acetohalobium arabaticum (strain ATCC 49924 / DSM 5501 / Z-7288) TaxID=574087 RepID=D9QT69_ACEAZ|nr:NAD(P)/FAD-dependent oxidoreductase [Acetohalobium arabaticum]ADL13569.1 FAD dependent oxidoreductase [Acetohalobium arabaticum DSM 5501]